MGTGTTSAAGLGAGSPPDATPIPSVNNTAAATPSTTPAAIRPGRSANARTLGTP
ncbi:hypothetical protein CLV40_107167 [Actinokineospora auranticolor]|uniref:Uncharacterized protein n=1 Tax=Actinokineospora auranticolor TaxID=155976 RepID=A0A2S6GQP8_9PSEU|nr:hypothetical protein CLV40_107167 [Actinokineospora auranticolor]